jgi:uncharacterized protein (TIGR02145 family)
MKNFLLFAVCIAASFTSIAQVGIGTATVDASAALEIESTTKGLLPPRMTIAQINAIATPVEGLIIYCLDGSTKGLLVNNGLEFINIVNGESLRKAAVATIVDSADNPAAGGTPSLVALTTLGLTNVTAAQTAYEVAIADATPVPATLAELQVIIDAVNTETAAVAAIVAAATNPAAGGTPSLADLTAAGLINITPAQEAYEIAIAYAAPAPITLAELQVIIDAVNKTDTITTVVDLISSSTGKTWMDRNLGATQAATSSTDAASYGDYYQWGRAKDGHEIKTSDTTASSSNSADPGHGKFIKADIGINNSWAQFVGQDNLWKSGFNDPCPTGYRVPTAVELQAELDSWGSDSTVAFSVLKLPLSGARDHTTFQMVQQTVFGFFWSSTVSSFNAKALLFNSTSYTVIFNDTVRAFGLPVRCIKKD